MMTDGDTQECNWFLREARPPYGRTASFRPTFQLKRLHVGVKTEPPDGERVCRCLEQYHFSSQGENQRFFMHTQQRSRMDN